MSGVDFRAPLILTLLDPGKLYSQWLISVEAIQRPIEQPSSQMMG